MGSSKRLRVCFYPGALKLGGVGKLTINMANYMANEGYDINFFLTNLEGDYVNQIPKNIKVFEGKGGALKSIFAFIKYLLKRKPDAIISSRDYLNFICIICVKIFSPKTTIISSIHVDYSGMPTRKKNFFESLLILLYAHAYKRSDHIVAVSKGVANDFTRRFNISGEKLKIIYNATYDSELYVVNKPILFNNFFDENKKIIISVGRLTHQKNFDMLIKAFSLVRKKVDCKLLILGEGELRNDLEGLVNRLNLENCVLMPGFVHNPIDYIKKSNVFVMSSLYEGFGNVIVEAMGTGISIVSTNCPSGPSEILENGLYGKLVQIDDIQGMCNSIIESLDNPFDKHSIISRAKVFSIKNISDQYLNLIEK
jgi:glycosyltransferase involved in cell wall biosynthesis